MWNLYELTFVCGFEEPVSRADPRRHGARAEVRILPGFVRQLQAHGGDVAFSDRYDPPARNTARALQRSPPLLGSTLSSFHLNDKVFFCFSLTVLSRGSS